MLDLVPLVHQVAVGDPPLAVPPLEPIDVAPAERLQHHPVGIGPPLAGADVGLDVGGVRAGELDDRVGDGVHRGCVALAQRRVT